MEQKERILHIAFNTVCIIESLRLDDVRTGKKLYDGVLERTKKEINALQLSYNYVRNKAELMSALEGILDGIKNNQLLPFIHFEIHGSERGLILESNTIVTWKELVKILRKINYAVNNNLVVTLAVCYGENVTRANSQDATAPFAILIAPRTKVSISRIEDGFRNFFLKLFHNMSINEAIEALNESEIPGDFAFYDAEGLFLGQWNSYKKQYEDPKIREEKFLKIYEDAKNYSNDIESAGISEEQFREYVIEAIEEREKKVPELLKHHLLHNKPNESDKFRGCVTEFEETILANDIKPSYLSFEDYERILINSYSHVIIFEKFLLLSLEAPTGIVAATEQQELMSFMRAYSFHESLVNATKALKPEELQKVILEELYFEKRIIERALTRLYEKYPEARPTPDSDR